MRRIAAALTLTTLLLAGCGGDDEPTATDEAIETTTEAEAADGPADDTPDDGAAGDAPDEPTDAPGGEGSCPFVTAAALEEAFDEPIDEFSANELGCQFSGEGTLAIVVVPIDIEIDPETYAEESTASCDEGTVVEVEAGDLAYACQAIGPSASVFEGDRLVNLSVLTTDDPDAVLDAFVEVLPHVTVTG